LDLTFMVLPLPSGPFQARELLADPYVVAVRPDSPLGRDGGPIALHELDGYPLISYGRMREVHAIENRLGHPALRKQIVFRSHDSGTILGLAAEGVGAAVVSWLSIDPHRPGLRVMPIADVSPRVVGAAWHGDRYQIPAAAAFIDLACATATAESDLLPTAKPKRARRPRPRS
jgi:DNA-binding transcriptional LysR family regulator